MNSVKTAPNANGNYSLATPISLIDTPMIDPTPSPNPDKSLSGYFLMVQSYYSCVFRHLVCNNFAVNEPV